MAGSTTIEWCDATFNPWWGCKRVSPACAHCYADAWARRIGRGDLWDNNGEHAFRFFGAKHWAEPLKWARNLPAKLGRRPRIFCASMADVFEDREELVSERHRLFHLISTTPELDWLVLTKRPEFMRDWLGEYWLTGDEPLANVWIGTSIENARFTWRADVLREIPAAVRFISAEPLLGSLFPRLFPSSHPDRTPMRGDGRAQPPDALPGHGEEGVNAAGVAEGLDGLATAGESRPMRRAPLDLTGIDWLIVGGESGGRKARPMHPEWARELRDACCTWSKFGSTLERCECEERPAFFFKQWGSWAPTDGGPGKLGDICLSEDGQRDVVDENYVCCWNESDGTWMRYMGANPKSGGRLLDGREWNEMPVREAVAA